MICAWQIRLLSFDDREQEIINKVVGDPFPPIEFGLTTISYKLVLSCAL